MEQFYRFSADLKKDKNLNNDEKVAFMYIYDRMCSSVKRSEFFDNSKNDYYVIYTVDEMIGDLNKSKNTVLKVFRKLEELGYIVAKKLAHKATRFFVPSFTRGSEIEPKQVQKLNPNHTNLNHNNKHIDTNVTLNDKNSNKKIVNGSVKSKNSIIIDKPQSKNMHFNDNDAKQNILNGVKAKVDGCSKPFINTMVKYTKDHNELDKLFGIIFKSKNNAKKSLSNKFKYAEDALTFEKNEYLMPELNRTMNQLFLKVNIDNSIKSKFGYIYNSLVKFFKQRVYDYVGTIKSYGNSYFNIPVIKLDK